MGCEGYFELAQLYPFTYLAQHDSSDAPPLDLAAVGIPGEPGIVKGILREH